MDVTLRSGLAPLGVTKPCDLSEDNRGLSVKAPPPSSSFSQGYGRNGADRTDILPLAVSFTAARWTRNAQVIEAASITSLLRCRRLPTGVALPRERAPGRRWDPQEAVQDLGSGSWASMGEARRSRLSSRNQPSGARMSPLASIGDISPLMRHLRIHV